MKWGEHFTSWYVNETLIRCDISNEVASMLYYLYESNNTFSALWDGSQLKIISQYDIFNTESILHIKNNNLKPTIAFDRNLASETISLFEGKVCNNHDDTYKLICALFTYANVVDALCDPTIAIYEGAQSNSSKNALKEIEQFRLMDNINPMAYIELYWEAKYINPNYIQEVKNLDAPVISQKIKDEDYKKLLYCFKVNYPIILKAVVINKLSYQNPFSKIQQLNDWIINHYFSKREALCAAQSLFCDSPFSNIVKSTQSKKGPDLIKIARNATWDLAYITYMYDCSKENPNQPYIFATKEKKLRNLIDAIFLTNDPEETLRLYFGKNNSKQLFNNINKFNQRLNNRECFDLSSKIDEIESIITELETEIMNLFC